MKLEPIGASRRTFLKAGTLSVASLALATRTAVAPAQGAQQVDENDPQAQGLGYKRDAAKVDKHKFSNYQAGSACANCQLFQGTAGAASGPCQIFAGKLVSAKGWCSAYVKKA